MENTTPPSVESPLLSPAVSLKEQTTSRLRTCIRRGIRGLFLVSTGFLAHELLDTTPKSAPPAPAHHARLEYLTPKEKRYRDSLRSAFQACTERWPHIFQNASLQPKGKILFLKDSFPPIALQGQWQEWQEGFSLTLSIDPNGSLRSLREEAGDTTTEIWPEQQNIHSTKTTKAQREETWTTASDFLTSICSHDGKVRSLLFEGESIDATTPPPLLLDQLQTPQRIFLFQKTFGNYEAPVSRQPLLATIARQLSDNPHLAPNDVILDIPVFLRTFRMSLKEWQEKGYRTGACNTYAEVACEALAHHGYPAHYLTYWPKGNKIDEWHAAAGFPMEKGWVIVDGSMEHCTFVSSPEQYGQTIGMEPATNPIMGRLRWSRPPTSGDRFWQLIHVPKKK